LGLTGLTLRVGLITTNEQLKVTFRDISAKEPATATATTPSATEVSQEMAELESSVIGFTNGKFGSPNVNHQISELLLLSSPEVWHFLKRLIQLLPQEANGY